MAVLLKVLSCSELKRVRIGTVAIVLAVARFAGVAAAADMSTKGTPPPSGTAYDWTGFYIGGHLGYAAGSSAWTASAAGVPNLSLPIAPPISTWLVVKDTRR